MADSNTPSGLSRATAYVPAVTVVSLFILAVFNIGYFSKIGLHFLGVMDFSNLVYSFSFIVAIITGSVSISLWGGYFEWLQNHAQDRTGRKKILWCFIGLVVFVGMVIATIYIFFPQFAPKQFLSDRLAAGFFVIAAVLLLLVEYADYQKRSKFEVSELFVSFVISFFAIYYLGRAVAEYEIYTVKTTYEFKLKDLVQPIVGKILRSSSTGFIIYVDDRIMFLPQGEIKRVRAVAEFVGY